MIVARGAPSDQGSLEDRLHRPRQQALNGIAGRAYQSRVRRHWEHARHRVEYRAESRRADSVHNALREHRSFYGRQIR